MTEPQPFQLTHPGIYRCRDGTLRVMRRAYWTSDNTVDPWIVVGGGSNDTMYHRNGKLTSSLLVNSASDLEIVALVLAVDEDGNPVTASDTTPLLTPDIEQWLAANGFVLRHKMHGNFRRMWVRQPDAEEHVAVQVSGSEAGVPVEVLAGTLRRGKWRAKCSAWCKTRGQLLKLVELVEEVQA